MNKRHLVIAISSISGGGKSTVARKLEEILGDAVSIHFDDYETPQTYPEGPAALLDKDVDFNRVRSPLLAQHLRALRRGEKISAPKTGEVVHPARYIIFESPLGRAQHETGQYIDYLVFIDTPLEVGLARRFKREILTADIEHMTRAEMLHQLKQITWLSDNYLLWMRKAYLIQREIVRPTSDLILAWDQSPQALALEVIAGLAEANLVESTASILQVPLSNEGTSIQPEE